jgi:hypothetical protein
MPKSTAGKSPRKKPAGKSPRKKPQEKAKLEWHNGCTCVCQSPQLCVPLVAQFAKLKDPQGGFWSVPAAVKPLHERPAKHRTPKVELEIQQNTAFRAAWSNHIQPNSGYISRVHFHPRVVALCKVTEGDRNLMPRAVPRLMAESIGNYTNADQIPGCENGNYFPVPNCPLDIATARLHDLQATTSNPHSPPPPMSANSTAMAAELSPV